MIPEKQSQMLEVLADVVALSPEVRFGQLLAHLGFLGEAHFDRGLGYIEDDDFLQVLVRHRSELKARLQGAPNQLPNVSEAAASSPAAS